MKMDRSEIERFRRLRKCGKICENEYRNKTVNWVIQFLITEYMYEFVQELGYGGYGDVVEMLNTDGHSVAVKIILKEYESPMETEMWPSFDHANIQPLLKIIPIDAAEARVFIMPKQKTSLFEILRDGKLSHSSTPLTWQLMKQWFCHILRGLAYLHDRKLCHLDMKPENVLILDDLSAVICDFSTIGATDEQIRSIGVPEFCYPPEACRFHGLGINSDGDKFDMWTVGMLILNFFTRYSIDDDVAKADDWSEQVYPHLFMALKDPNFEVTVNLYYPSLKADTQSVKILKNFILMFLRVDPQERPSAKFALEHEFLEIGNVNILPDKMWIEKVPSESIKVAVELYAALKDVLSINPEVSFNTEEISDQRAILSVEKELEQKDLENVADICKNISDENDSNDILCCLRNMFRSANASETLSAEIVPQLDDQTLNVVLHDSTGIQSEAIENLFKIEIDPNLGGNEDPEIEPEFKEKQNDSRSEDLSLKSKFTSDATKSDDKISETGSKTSKIESNTGETVESVKEHMENENTGPQRKTVGRRIRGWFRKRWEGLRKCCCCCQQSSDEN